METAKRLVREVIEEAWNRGDLKLIDTAVTGDYRRVVPGQVLEGATGFKLRIAAVRTAMPDFRTEIEAIITEGERGVVRWTATGTHRGEMLGFPPTGRALKWSGLTWFELDGGRIRFEWELFDVPMFLAQLRAPARA